MNETDISEWPEEAVQLYPTNSLAGKANIESINKLNEVQRTIQAKDSPRPIPERYTLHETGNLPHFLTICVGARFMLTVNLDIDDRLVNGTIGTIRYIKTSTSLINTTIYIEFEDPLAGNKLKSNSSTVRGNRVPICADVMSFRIHNTEHQRKQFPGILAHAITIHKSQGSTFNHMYGYVGNTKNGFEKTPGMCYTMISRAKSRSTIKLNGFNRSMLTKNSSALKEMERMKTANRVFEFKHPLIQYENKSTLILFNIVSYNKHIHHLLADPVYLKFSSICCFTETKMVNPENIINLIHTDWNGLYSQRDHGLSISFNTKKITLVEQLEIHNQIEGLAAIFEKGNEKFIIFLIYNKPSSKVQLFLTELAHQLHIFQELTYRMILLGDFNMDPRSLSNENTLALNEIKSFFQLQDRVDFITHKHGGILDLIFDTSDDGNYNIDWLSSAFSDHYQIFYTF